MSTTDINTHYGKNIKWTVYRNGYNAFVGTLTLDGAAYDISARVFTAYIRTPSGSENKLTLTEGSGITNGGSTGLLTIYLTEAQLATLPRDRYFIVIEYPVAGKGDYPLCQGFIEVSYETNPGTTTTTATIPVSINGTTVSMAVTLGGGEVSSDDLALKANIASPTFTGIPASPTAAQGTNTTQIATTAFVVAEIAASGGSGTIKGAVSSGIIPYASAADTVADTSLKYVSGDNDDVTIQIGPSSIPFLQSRDTPTDASKSLFFGYDCGKVFYATNTGYANTAMGFEAAKALAGASSNTIYGYQAAKALTSGSLNTYFGTLAGTTNTTGSQNTGLGYHALASSTGASKTAVGYEALYRNTHASISTAVGWHALYLSTTGMNTAIGHEAGGNVSTGTRNTILGSEAGVVLSTANDNTLLGHHAGYAGAIGSDNTMVGAFTGILSTGTGNVHVGKDAGEIITAGNNNVFIGANAAETKTGGSQNIVIGQGITTSAVGSSNELNIGGAIKGTALYGSATTTTLNLIAKVGVGMTTAPTAFMDCAPSTTDNAGLRVQPGAAPTSPNNGDIWIDSTAHTMHVRINGVTKSIDLT